MPQNDLIIKELKFDIDIGDNNNFDKVELDLSNLTTNFLIPSFDKRINSFFDEKEDFVFNRIVINIGEVSLKDKISITKSITDKLIREIKNSRQLNAPTFRSNEALIIYLLRFGFLPWWANNKTKFNNFLSRNSYDENSKKKIYSIVTKNELHFNRFFNTLNSKNKTVFFKKYLQKNYSYFFNSNLFLEILLESVLGKIESRDKALIHYELFTSLLKYKNKSVVGFSLVLKKIIDDFNIEWNIVNEHLLLKSKKNKSFLNLLQFDENLLFSNQLPSKSDLSSLAQIRKYIEYGTINELKNFGLPYLTDEFTHLLNSDKKSLSVLFLQLNVYNEPIKLYRISKLLNLNNLHEYLKITFESSHSFLLRHTYSFLKFMELKGEIKNPSFFYFINSIIKLKTSSGANKENFYKNLINLISNNYHLSDTNIFIEFYFFSTSQVYQTEFQDVIELFYINEIRGDSNNSVANLINQLETSNTFSYTALLSSLQRNHYNLLIGQINFLNQSIVLNTWTKSYSEKFIFDLLIGQKSSNRNPLLYVIKAYAKATNFDIHKLVISVLMEFYPTDLFIEKQSMAILEYVLLVNQPEAYKKFSKKEQLFIQRIIKNKTLKNKFDLTTFTYNLELNSTLLSSIQRNYYHLLITKINFLNESIIFNSWTQSFTEAFIFNLIIEEKSWNGNSLLNILKIYAKTNRFDVHQLVIAVLMKFYSTKILIEKGSVDILEYVFLVNRPEVYQKFSKKEQLFITNELKVTSFKNNTALNSPLLSSTQKSYFHLLNTQINFLNQLLVFNSWTKSFTETFIFNLIISQKHWNRNSILNILKIYASENNFDIHRLVIAVLMKFYPTTISIEKGSDDILEYILFVNEPAVYQKFSKREQLFIQNTINNKTVKNKLEIGSFKYNVALDSSLLSDSQKSYYSLLINHINFLNKSVVFNSWTKSYTEVFVFNLLIEQKESNRSSLLKTLKIYAKRNNFDIHRLVIAVLIKFYSTPILIEKGGADILEYVLLILKPQFYTKLTKKEQLFIQTIEGNKTLKSKFELASFKYKSELDYLIHHSDLQEFKNEGTFFKQNLSYLFEEINSIIDSNTSLKLNKNQLLQILIIELKKYTSKNNQINYQIILENIADITNIDIEKLSILLLKRLGNKVSYTANDAHLLNQINDSFFSLSNLKQASSKSINDVIKLVQKISDQNIKGKILTEYIISSSMVVLKLKDKNYKAFINSLSSNKQNNFFIILTNILSTLSYQKRIEFSLRLKQKALLFSQEKNLSDEQFYHKLLNEINLKDAVLFKKIKPQLSFSMDSLFSMLSYEQSNTEIKGTYSKNTLQEFDDEDAIKRLSNFEIKNYKPINSLNKRDFDYFLSLKNELNKENKSQLFKFESFKNIEDIIESDTTLLDFIILYIDDFELLIEFAQASFNEPIKTRLEALLKSDQSKIGKLETELIKLHKVTFFTTLNRLEFKIILRVYILKSFAYYKQNMKFNISEFTLNFIENLSTNRKINFKQTSSIAGHIGTGTTVEKQIKEGIVSFFDRNNFEFIQKNVKEAEFFKNNIYFFILNNQKYNSEEDQNLTILEILNFIKTRIKKKDTPYIKEFLLEKKTASFFASEFKNVDIDVQIEVLNLLELSNNNSFSIKNFYQEIIKLNKSSDEYIRFIFEYIIEENLWNKPSILYVFDHIYTKLKNKKGFKEFKFILDLEIYYPSIKLILSSVKKIDKTDKLELIKYYIQQGKLPKNLEPKKDIYIQLLKAYTSKKQLKHLFIEFSGDSMVSKNFIEISSKALFIDVILEELEDIDAEFKYIFELALQSNTSLSIEKEYILYDLLLNNIITPRSIYKSNLKLILSNVKSLIPKTYQTILKIIYKLVLNSSDLKTNIPLITYLNLETFSKKSSVIKPFKFNVRNSTLSDTLLLEQKSPLLSYILSESTSIAASVTKSKEDISLKNEEVEFNTFINQIRYFVEFKSFNRTSELNNQTTLYLTFLKFKSKLILKKQLHSWSKYPNKISVLFKLFPEKELTKIFEFIHPNQLSSIKNFNEVLKLFNYNSLQKYLNLNSIQKFTSKILNVWSAQSIIINNPNIILHSLFEELLLHPDIDAQVLVEKLEKGLADYSIEQASIIKAILIQSNIYKVKKKSEQSIVLNEDSSISEPEGSIYINNAGLILIWPFLSTLFNKLDLLSGKSFIDDNSLQKAILLTQYVIYEGNNNEETNLVLNKILCGVSPDFFVDTEIELSEMEKSITKTLLNAVTANWEQLNKTSVQTFKETFLKREGIIQKVDDNYKLIVEKKPFDMLLRTIPWNISMIQNSFMDFRLIVEWEN